MKRKKPEGQEMAGLMLHDGEPHMYGHNHHLAVSHPNLEEMQQHGLTNKMPPSYEECLKMQQAQSMATGLAGNQQQQESQFYGMHPRQQSIPASMTYPHMSPLMSPPQSVQSSHALSPPGTTTSPQQMVHQTSPIKSRGMQLPTSPTHMAAMRGAAVHQRHQSFDFPDSNQQAQQMGHPAMIYPYTLPTPPQNGDPSTNFMTPSPDSPGQWSSASPQSHSDWSEGIHSPPGTNNFQQLKQPQQQQDGIYI